MYPLSVGRTQSATIPLDTPDIKITCEVSRGSLETPVGLVSATRDPSVTFTLTNTSGDGEYICYRNIFNTRTPILTLSVGAPTTGSVGLTSQGITLTVVLVLLIAVVVVVIVVVLVVLFVYIYRNKSTKNTKKHSAVKMTPLKEITSDNETDDPLDSPGC